MWRFEDRSVVSVNKLLNKLWCGWLFDTSPWAHFMQVLWSHNINLSKLCPPPPPPPPPARAGNAENASLPTRYHHLYILGRVTLICTRKLTVIGSDDGLQPGRHQAIIWTNAEILWIGTLGLNFGESLDEIHIFSFKRMHRKCRLQNSGHFVSASMCQLQ